ncbi:MAG: dual specificity protein phosphatase family protein [Planctomycetota bacterium]|jgi:protein tyrosine/serine phosphatase
MKSTVFRGFLVLVLILGAMNGCEKSTPQSPEATETDPAQFTTAKKIDLPGCGNLYKVSDTLYRGEQPTAEGFKELEKRGIKTVVNLRSLHSDRDELEGTKLGYEHIRMEAWDPEPEAVKAFLKIVTDPEKQPVFVHCMHGADRTGTMVAVYRIVVEGWDKEKAIDEMRNGPFGFHEIWTGLPEFLKELDIEGLQKEFPTMP